MTNPDRPLLLASIAGATGGPVGLLLMMVVGGGVFCFVSWGCLRATSQIKTSPDHSLFVHRHHTRCREGHC